MVVRVDQVIAVILVSGKVYLLHAFGGNGVEILERVELMVDRAHVDVVDIEQDQAIGAPGDLAEELPFGEVRIAERHVARDILQQDSATEEVLHGPHPLDDGSKIDAARIDAIWRDCRARFSAGGPFLFGAFGAADAMYAPVIWRFHTYAVAVSAPARAYMDAMMALPAWREWRDAARRETWVLPQDEVDWPEVVRE